MWLELPELFFMNAFNRKSNSFFDPESEISKFGKTSAASSFLPSPAITTSLTKGAKCSMKRARKSPP